MSSSTDDSVNVEMVGTPPLKEVLCTVRGIQDFHEYDSLDDLIATLKHFEMNSVEKMQDSRYVWFDFHKPTKETLEIIEGLFRIFPVTIDSILDKITITDEVVQFPHYIYTTFSEDVDDSTDEYLKILISKYWFVTIHDHEIRDPKEVLEKVKNFIEFSPNRVIPSPDWILYAYIDCTSKLYANSIVMMDQYLPRCESILDEAENCDELVFQVEFKELHGLLERIEFARKTSAQIHRMLQAKQKIFSKISQYSSKIISSEVQSKFHDLLDNLELAMVKLESTKETLFQAHYGYLSRTMVDIVESSDVSDRYLNIIMILSLLMVPFQTISTIFGMNVPVPMGDIQDNLGPWFGIFAFEIICSVVLIFGSLILLRIFERCSERGK
jgi:Mg2+ and Co2+ transporter CorA